MAWIEKDPQEVIDYVLDWSARLGGDEIATSTWAITAGVTKDSDTTESRSAIIWISGGTAGNVYSLTNTITTDGGRTLEETIYLSVAEKSPAFTGTTITQADVIRLAHRKLGLVSAEESVSADQEDYANDVLQGIWDEHSGLMDFSITAPGRRYYMALADLLAAEIAPHYAVAGPDRSRALSRMRAILLTDDRPDARDTDGNGAVSVEEAEAFARSVYY